MTTINYESLQTCRRTLRDHGFSPAGCTGTHGHGNTVWQDGTGNTAEITLDQCTGCFVLFCPFHPDHHTTKATLHALEGVPAITSFITTTKGGTCV